jgi:hypothetical protein
MASIHHNLPTAVLQGADLKLAQDRVLARLYGAEESARKVRSAPALVKERVAEAHKDANALCEEFGALGMEV